MKIAIVCYYHLDPTVSLVKYLNQFAKIDFYCLFNQLDKSSVPLDFNHILVPDGFVSESICNKIIKNNIALYLDKNIVVNFFIFRSASFLEWRNYPLLLQLAKKIKTEAYDLVHLIGQNVWITSLNAILSPIPTVQTIHESYPHSRIKYLWLHKILMRYLAKNRSDLIFPSATTLKRFRSHFTVNSQKLHIIYFGAFEIYKYYVQGLVPEEKNTILFYGRFSRNKGVDYLIRASQILLRSQPDLKIILAGSGDEIEWIYDIQNDPHFEVINSKHYLPTELIVRLIQRATIIVCPYISASQSGVIMTAFAFKKPIIASEVDGLMEVIKHNITGILVPPKDPLALSEAINLLLTHPEMRSSIKRNIENEITNGSFAWDKIAYQTKEVYINSIQSTHKS